MLKLLSLYLSLQWHLWKNPQHFCATTYINIIPIRPPPLFVIPHISPLYIYDPKSSSPSLWYYHYHNIFCTIHPLLLLLPPFMIHLNVHCHWHNMLLDPFSFTSTISYIPMKLPPSPHNQHHWYHNYPHLYKIFPGHTMPCHCLSFPVPLLLPQPPLTSSNIIILSTSAMNIYLWCATPLYIFTLYSTAIYLPMTFPPSQLSVH